ncbi:hypothetical protein R83H12_00271 [Fibrobacteria bacterium R8-3-H12]
MRKQVVFFGLFLALAAPIWGQPYFTGDGGKGIKLAVLEPEGKGLSKDELWMLSLAQGTIMANFNKYSAVTIIDRQNLEAIIAEQKHSLSAMTSDEDAIQIGNLANANHILMGKITKTPNAFILELAITDAETGVRKASLLPKTVSPKEFENLSALKEASADLLKQLGVSLTDEQLAELRGPVAETQVQAQTALAHGVVAQRQGTSVAALSYFYQAAAFDPSLAEAVKRSSVMSANISGINLGENIRNDIEWRKKWVEQLKETEETFYKIISSAPLPYTLYYSTVIETKNIDYQEETADLSISERWLANAEWFAAFQRSLKAADAVLRGLNATNRKKDWGLSEWPREGVSETNPFGSSNYVNDDDNISIEFELVNQQGRVIGNTGTSMSHFFGIYISLYSNFVVSYTVAISGTLTFKAVKAGDISNNLSIRIASVNGKPPETARFPIIAVTTKEFPKYKTQTRRTNFTDSRDGKKYKAVEIVSQTWMAENLNYNAKGSKCYGEGGKDRSKVVAYKANEVIYKPFSNAEIQANCAKYGRLYDWETAQKACPKGWHLPNDWEWKELKSAFYGYSYTSGTRLKATSGWNDNDYKGKSGNGTDEFGFSALPGGYYYPGIGFMNVGNIGEWWSATEEKREGYNDYGYSWKMISHSEEVRSDGYSKNHLFNVRCVQD